MNCDSPCRQPYKQNCLMIGVSFLLLALVAGLVYNSPTLRTADKLFLCEGLIAYPKLRDLVQVHAASQAWEDTHLCF